jgi:glycosyltransferase involved in cell wall biosynthesis
MAGLRIAHLCHWLEVGGTEQVIFDLCRLGTDEQFVVSCHDGPMRPILEARGIEARVGEDLDTRISRLADADVVNVHWLEYQPPVFAAAQASGKPLVFTLHGLSQLPRLPGPILCTSKRAYDLQEPNRDRRMLALNGVDTSLFHPPAQRNREKVRIIRVCRPVRCAEYFWPAVLEVLRACPETEVQLVGGPAYSLGRIESLGNRHNVAELLRGADLFAYAPWPHEGTRDLVVLEALASGLPCVVSDVPCVRESVVHEKTGLLTPFGDAQAFAAALTRLTRDPMLRESMSRHAAGMAREYFDIRLRLPIYESAYERALDAPANGRSRVTVA